MSRTAEKSAGEIAWKSQPFGKIVRPLRNDSLWMNRVEIDMTIDFSLATTPKVLFAINLGKQSAVDVPVYGGNADRTVRVLQSPSPGYGSRRTELLQVCDDNCLSCFCFASIPARQTKELCLLRVKSLEYCVLFREVPIDKTVPLM